MNFQDFKDHTFGTYLAVQPSGPSRIAIEELVNKLGLSNPEKPMEYHTTVIYSKKPCPQITNANIELPIWGEGKKFEIFENAKDGAKCVVLLIDSPQLQTLHKNLMETYGCTYDFPEYIPHITLSYVVPDHIQEHPMTINIKYDSYICTPLDNNH